MVISQGVCRYVKWMDVGSDIKYKGVIMEKWSIILVLVVLVVVILMVNPPSHDPELYKAMKGVMEKQDPTVRATLCKHYRLKAGLKSFSQGEEMEKRNAKLMVSLCSREYGH